MAGLNRYQTAGNIINRTAVLVGLGSTTDPYSSPDPAFTQLTYLLNECGEELVGDNVWEKLTARHEFTTQPGDTGIYDLPADFSSMIDQTGWQQGAPGAAYPLLGPATAQIWSYLVASELYTVTIYAWFRELDGKLQLWPQPPPEGIPIAYEYVSRGWAQNGDSDPQNPTFTDTCDKSSDIVLYEPVLMVKKLKLAFLQAKGFDTTKAQAEYNKALDTWISKDKPAPVLSLNSCHGYGYRFLNGYTNVPETGYGD